MATVHPSRLGLVPGGSARRPAPPISSTSASPKPLDLPEQSMSPVSREEQLRQKLIERRKRQSASENGTGVGAATVMSIKGRAGEVDDRETRSKGKGRELLPEGSGDETHLFGDDSSTSRSGSRRQPRGYDDERRRAARSSSTSPRKGRYRDEEESESVSLRRRHGGEHRYSRELEPRDDQLDRSRRSDNEREQGRRGNGKSDKWDQRSGKAEERSSRNGHRDSSSRRPIDDMRQPDRRHDDHRTSYNDRPRRSSPSYDPPKILPPIRMTMDGPPPQMPPFPPNLPPQNQNGNGNGNGNGYGYGDRRDLGPQNQGGHGRGPPYRSGHYGNADFEQRRIDRERSTITVWPPSPKAPYKDEEEVEAERQEAKRLKKQKEKERSSKKRRSKRYASETSSSEDDDTESISEFSDDSRRRRKYKSSSRSKKTTTTSKRTRRRRYSSEEEDDSEDDDGESEYDRRKRRGNSRSNSKEESKSRYKDKNEGLAGDDAWVEKPLERKGAAGIVTDRNVLVLPPAEDDSDEEVGPRLPGDHSAKDKRWRSNFANMLPGEAEAMAAYAASGERIPRRGEIGLDSDRIAQFEDSGYVMSGNRNKRMNAVRLRKENQVISAEEKRAILNLQREERIKKEGAIISQFKELMETNLRKQGLNKPT